MKMTYEDKLLICCARRNIDEDIVDEIYSILKCKLDWTHVVQRSRQQGVAPLLFHNLRKINVDNSIPDPVMRELGAVYYGNARRNIRIINELNTILQSFKNAGIDVILLKGIAVAEVIYKNLSLRPVTDIDLLVKEKDFDEIRKLLLEHSYVPYHSLPSLRGIEAVRYAHYFQQIRFVSQKRTSIEIHFRLINMGIPEEDEMFVWKRGVPLKIDDDEVVVPSLEDLLLLLCIHANQHNYYKLLFFSDIAELIRYYGTKIDWDYFTEHIHRKKLNASIYNTLHRTKLLLGVEIPAEISIALRPHIWRRVIFNLLWNKKKTLQLRNHRRRSEIEAPLLYILEMGTLHEKLLFLKNILFPPLRWLYHRHSRSNSVMLYAQHLKHLFFKNA